MKIYNIGVYRVVGGKDICEKIIQDEDECKVAAAQLNSVFEFSPGVTWRGGCFQRGGKTYFNANLASTSVLGYRVCRSLSGTFLKCVTKKIFS